MKTLPSVFVLAAALAVLAGCSTPETRIKSNPAVYSQLTPEQQQLIKEGKIALGFDQAMVQLALGKPDRIRLRTEASGTSEIWSYVTNQGDFGPPYFGGYYYPYRYGMGGPYYPIYPYYSADPGYFGYQEHENFRVVFQNGRVVMIEKEE